MKVLVVREWTNPKEPERNKARYKIAGEMLDYYEKLVKEKEIKLNFSSWTMKDGTMMNLAEFETFEDFEKLMTDPEWMKYLSKLSYFQDNVRTRIMFPTVQMPPET